MSGFSRTIVIDRSYVEDAYQAFHPVAGERGTAGIFDRSGSGDTGLSCR